MPVFWKKRNPLVLQKINIPPRDTTNTRTQLSTTTYLEVIGFIAEQLRGHVVRGPYNSARHVLRAGQLPRDPQISEFYNLTLVGQEDVLSLQGEREGLV